MLTKCCVTIKWDDHCISVTHEDRSVAENFLFMMKGRDQYTELDVKILDLALILHAEHGGGNNSTSRYV